MVLFSLFCQFRTDFEPGSWQGKVCLIFGPTDSDVYILTYSSSGSRVKISSEVQLGLLGYGKNYNIKYILKKRKFSRTPYWKVNEN